MLLSSWRAKRDQSEEAEKAFFWWDDGEHQAWSPFSLLEIYWVSQTMFIGNTQTLMNGLLNI